jgi:hypothetical protein
MAEEARATLQDLKQAQVDLALWDDRWANDTSGNPDKHFSKRQAARSRVRALTAKLKAQGDLPMTDHERLCATLDRVHPKARSGEVVEHDGLRYRRRFFPEEKSRSGKTVTEWGRTWEAV